jgi:hypothetical protein
MEKENRKLLERNQLLLASRAELQVSSEQLVRGSLAGRR